MSLRPLQFGVDQMPAPWPELDEDGELLVGEELAEIRRSEYFAAEFAAAMLEDKAAGEPIAVQPCDGTVTISGCPKCGVYREHPGQSNSAIGQTLGAMPYVEGDHVPIR